MITLQLDLHSKRTGKTTSLGSAVIINDGTSTDPKRGDYEISVARKNTGQTLRRGKIKKFPRLSYNVWRMVARLLLEAFPEEKPKQPSAVVPDGYRLVPIEPSFEMLAEMRTRLRGAGVRGPDDPFRDYRETYKAMIGYAPEPK